MLPTARPIPSQQRLNSIPQFTTEIDGQNVHFLHLRSANPDALPLIATHGWPGSVVELLKVIEPLSEDFHVVVPSIPGYGFSGPTRETGWNVERVARAWAQLMNRLGHTRYGAHGSDWGSSITRELGRINAEHVVGIHVTMIGTPPPPDAAPFTDEERQRLKHGERYQRELFGYAALQSTRPQTLAFALHDSAVGQLAWIVEKFKDWTDSADAPEDAVDRDQMLTDVMLYWLTGTAASSARLYRESAGAWGRQPEPSVADYTMGGEAGSCGTTAAPPTTPTATTTTSTASCTASPCPATNPWVPWPGPPEPGSETTTPEGGDRMSPREPRPARTADPPVRA